MIDCESWYHLVNYHYVPDRKDFPSGIVHCDMGSIPEFFQKIKQYPNNKYVVISSRSDYGLHYQREFPPYSDYSKAVNMFISPHECHWGYDDVQLPARINRRRCNQTDTYSIKCYSFTEATFNEIPSNVAHWFITNNTVLDDNRITCIPFGINGTDGNKTPGDLICAKAQSMNWGGDLAENLYVNFQFYTNERLKLYYLYKAMEIATVERDIPFEDYIKRLVHHNCVLCPPGNGWDSYRTLEALYMGCIPIMELNPGLLFYTKLNLPIIFTHSLEAVTTPILEGIRHSKYYDRTTWDLTAVTLSYWKQKIEAVWESSH